MAVALNRRDTESGGVGREEVADYCFDITSLSIVPARFRFSSFSSPKRKKETSAICGPSCQFEFDMASRVERLNNNQNKTATTTRFKTKAWIFKFPLSLS